MLEIERVKADEGRRLHSGTGRVRTMVRVREGRRHGVDEGKSPRRAAAGCGRGYESGEGAGRVRTRGGVRVECR